MVDTVEIEAECSDCEGTGIYKGFAEPKGVGVVCLPCEGTGKRVFTYIPFMGRKQRENITHVRMSAGYFLAKRVGPVGDSISYEEFLAGKMPRLKRMKVKK